MERLHYSKLAFVLPIICLSSCNDTGDPLKNLPSSFAQREHQQPISSQSLLIIAEELGKHFGTPQQPVTSPSLPIDFGASGENSPQPNDSKFEVGRRVYYSNCSRCHGYSGEGAGNDKEKRALAPRDFRDGVFKWKSTRFQAKPRRHDLLETVRLGIPGTDMPGFPELSDEERTAVVEYVRWLAIRGQLEKQIGLIAADYEGEESALQKEIAGFFADELDDVSEQWMMAELEEQIFRPAIAATEATAESIERGRKLFLETRTSCTRCHGMDGKGPSNPDKFRLTDSWDQPVKIDDLSTRSFHGGDAPEDLYRRIALGIGGSPMPAGINVLQPTEIWDVVNYIQSLRSQNTITDRVTRRPPPPGQAQLQRTPETPQADTATANTDDPDSEQDKQKTNGWGNLTGRFLYSGQPPQPMQLQVNKDLANCARKPKYVKSLQVGNNKGLANVVVYLRTPNPPIHPNYADSSQTPVTLSTKECEFSPHVLSILTNQQLRIHNEESIAQNVNIHGNRSQALNQVIPANGAITHEFSRSERFPLRITNNIHPWMLAYVLPQDNPYFAITDAEGRFRIENLPAGELEFQVWHERGKGPQGALRTEQWEAGVFSISLEPDGEVNLAELSIEADSFK